MHLEEDRKSKYLCGDNKMATTFRNEMFTLCQILQKKETTEQVACLMHDLFVTVENKNTGFVKKNLHGNFASVASHSNNQFHGFLFVDDNAGSLDMPYPLAIEKLALDERKLIEIGHRTLMRFIDLCLEDIKKQNDLLANAISPYYLYKGIEFEMQGEQLLSDIEMREAVCAFKDSKAYQALIGSDACTVFSKLDNENMLGLISSFEKEIIHCYTNIIPEDIKRFSMQTIGHYKDAPSVMYAMSVLLIAIREALRAAVQMMFEAICKCDLLVLNNDNIINIESRESNCICEVHKTLIQGISLSRMGDILLIDCDLPHEVHIHQFGIITATTCSLIGEMGDTTKYVYTIVDDDLNPIYNITNSIIRAGLPKIVK
jgi:hypothetical protein